MHGKGQGILSSIDGFWIYCYYRNESGIPDGPAKRESQKAGGSEEMDRPHFEENPSMRAVYPEDSRYVLEAFCIASGQVGILLTLGENADLP